MRPSKVARPDDKSPKMTTRPIQTDQTPVTLLMLRRRAERVPEPLRDLQTALVRQARAYLASLELPPTGSEPEPDVAPVTSISARARTRSAP